MRPRFPRLQPPRPAPGQAGPEVQLQAPVTLDTRPTRRELLDARGIQSAADLLQDIPAPGVSRHVVIAARKTDFFQVLPAMLVLARPATITNLYLSTLGFNRPNAARLVELLEAGQVKRCCLMVSLFFEEDVAEQGTIARLRDTLPRFGGWYCATRNHMKLINAEFSDGRYIVCESSANLRTCSSAEQVVVTQDRELFGFYQKILEEMHAEGRLNEEAD
jgi:hypothetical protein